MNEEKHKECWGLPLDKNYIKKKMVKSTIIANLTWMLFLIPGTWVLVEEKELATIEAIALTAIVFIILNLVVFFTIPRILRNSGCFFNNEFLSISQSRKDGVLYFNQDNTLVIKKSPNNKFWILSSGNNKAKTPVKAFPYLVEFIDEIKNEIGSEKFSEKFRVIKQF